MSERTHINRRARAQERIVRRGDSVRQDQRIEINVARWTRVVTLHLVYRQCSHVNPPPVGRPRNCRVIRRISCLGDGDYQVPLQRVLMNIRNQFIEEEICVRLRKGSD